MQLFSRGESFHWKREMKLPQKSFSQKSFSEVLLLVGMLATLFIPSDLSPIKPWTEISSVSFLRVAIWLLGLSILPGNYVLRLVGVARELSKISRFVIEINLSLIISGILALVLYYLHVSIVFFPWIMLILLSILFSICWHKCSPVSNLIPTIPRWEAVLYAGALISIVVAFFVQANNQYLIAGDNWVALRPSVDVLAEVNVYSSFQTAEYPLMFGFILAGLSACFGLPLVNSYVLLFPFTALNILSFYALIKIVFGLTDRTSVISSFLYAFGGGLGLLLQLFVYQGRMDFWTLSYLAQDMYFSPFFWSSIQFSFKSLAVTLAFVSMALFVVGMSLTNRLGKGAVLILSSFALLSSFLIHILDAVMLAPVILILSYVYMRGRERYLYFTGFVAATVFIAFVLDSLMSGFYSSLILTKLTLFLSTMNTRLVMVGGAGALVILLALALGKRVLHLDIGAFDVHRLERVRIPIMLVLIGFYLAGLYFWFEAPSPSLEVTASFSWYRYVTRYGLLGVMGIVGFTLVRWEKGWYKVATLWCLAPIVVGAVWWGERTNAYLFPMLALFSAICLERIWETYSEWKINGSLETGKGYLKTFRLNLQPLTSFLIIVLLLLSFSSVAYGAGYYMVTEPPTGDDDARALAWINGRLPADAVVLVPTSYEFSQGVYAISSRQVLPSSSIATSYNSSAFIDLTKSLKSFGVGYGVTGGEDPTSVADVILKYSKTLYQAGAVRVVSLPTLSSPSSTNQDVVVWDRTPFGLRNVSDFGWFDDSFTSGWSFLGAEASTDGETLSLNWDYHVLDRQFPWVEKDVPLIDTDIYPYLIVRYKNTFNTSHGIEGTVNQYVSIVNGTGYPDGIVESVWLPANTGSEYGFLRAKLPKNETLSSIVIRMDNPRGLNGTIRLQIDYVGFSRIAFKEDFQYLRFLSMALPALWPANYSVTSEINNITGSSILVSVYNHNALERLETINSIQTVVFLNLTASIPDWGDEWMRIDDNILTGNLEGTKIILVGASLIDGANVEDLAEKIYELVS